MIATLDSSQFASLLIMTSAAFGLPLWSWMRVLAAYRVQEARRRQYEHQKELRRQQVEAQLAAMRQSILRDHGLAAMPDAPANP